MPDYDLRIVHLNDDELQRVSIRQVAEVFARGFNRDDIGAVEELIWDELRMNHRYLVALVDRRPIGVVSWRREFEWRHQLVELYHIAADPTAPIKGIGIRLIRAMEEDAHAVYRSMGYPGVWKFFIRTNGENRAQYLYLRAGYTHVATLPNYPRPGVRQEQYDRELPELYHGTLPDSYRPIA